jgi:hypothetical protein
MLANPVLNSIGAYSAFTATTGQWKAESASRAWIRDSSNLRRPSAGGQRGFASNANIKSC